MSILISFKNTVRRNMYKWHKIIGLITIIPVLFWCASGVMHPFLAHWFKPKIAHEFIISKPLKQDKILLSIREVLDTNSISEFKNIRIVSFQDKIYFQVKNKQDIWQYFDASTGKELIEGDKLYAENLARYFLADSTNSIISIEEQTEFSEQYKYINRLLPVYKVKFDRPDNMDVYVETPYSRLGTFNPTSRKAFLWVFNTFHNWSFLESISNSTLRISIMLLFLSIICLSAISGIVIYGFMWGKFKQLNPENTKSMLRKYHRQIGVLVAFVTLTFAFSGGYHATRKFEPNILPEMLYEPGIQTSAIQMDIKQLQIDWTRLTNFSIVKLEDAYYYQLFYAETDEKPKETEYINVKDGIEKENGDSEYAKYLSGIFKKRCSKLLNANSDCCELGVEGGVKSAKPKSTELVPSFEKREYGFTFKRLPVVRVSYDTPENTNLYIETSTSRLAGIVEDSDRYEGYSFAIFHKFLFMDWAGKNVRDIMMLLSALGVFVVCVFGIALYIKK